MIAGSRAQASTANNYFYVLMMGALLIAIVAGALSVGSLVAGWSSAGAADLAPLPAVQAQPAADRQPVPDWVIRLAD